MKVILHACCAPCLIHPWEQFSRQSCQVSAFFYNPNIHPAAEYFKRQQAVAVLAKERNIRVLSADYNPAEFFQAVNLKENSPDRCACCWRLRLEKTAELAVKEKCDFFSTTLLVSPYQDIGLIRRIGDTVAQDSGVKFYYRDFRPGFRRAHDAARQMGLYSQKYCGCIYSELERQAKKASK